MHNFFLMQGLDTSQIHVASQQFQLEKFILLVCSYTKYRNVLLDNHFLKRKDKTVFLTSRR